MEVYTIGYEGLEIDEFVDYLKSKRIQLVADIRKNPVSRKKGFSKHKMAQALREKKIDYIHIPGLGTPSAWRKQADAGLLTRDKMFQKFVDEVIPQHPDDLKTLRDLIRDKRTVLLCYEADADDCHRSFVADELKRLERGQLQVVDLKLVVDTRPLRKPGPAKRRSSRDLEM